MHGLPYQAISIGPMQIHAVDAVGLAGALVADAQRAGATHHVVTANAQFYNLAEQRTDFRDCLARAEYVCADGISLVWACRWLGKASVTRVAGVDLVEDLCAKSVASGVSVYFLGGREGSAQMASEVLARKYPGFRLAGLACPSYGFESDPQELREVLREIRRAKPSILLVALGAPRQELFIHRHIRPLRIPVAIGVGGSLEIIAGRLRRAPEWVQNAGFEWLFRWVQEPRRLAKRYLVGNTLFCFLLLRHLLRRESQRAARSTIPNLARARSAYQKPRR